MTTTSYRVAGHAVTLHFCREEDLALIRSFKPFRLEEVVKEPVMELTVDDAIELDATDHEIGHFDCGGCDTAVYRLSDRGYRIEFYNIKKQLCGGLQSDRTFRHNLLKVQCQEPSDRRFAINNTLMVCYAFATADQDTMLMHASVIRHAGKGYLMTAPSGTGKSTHTRLWYDNIPGCDLMNDDNPVVRIIDGQAIVYGSPWSGKTPCYRNIEAPIGGLVRLWQKPENSIRRLPVIEGYSHLLSAMSNMKWDERVFRGISHGVSELVRICGVWGLGCLPNAEAAFLCQRTLEGTDQPASPTTDFEER